MKKLFILLFAVTCLGFYSCEKEEDKKDDPNNPETPETPSSYIKIDNETIELTQAIVWSLQSPFIYEGDTGDRYVMTIADDSLVMDNGTLTGVLKGLQLELYSLELNGISEGTYVDFASQQIAPSYSAPKVSAGFNFETQQGEVLAISSGDDMKITKDGNKHKIEFDCTGPNGEVIELLFYGELDILTDKKGGYKGLIK